MICYRDKTYCSYYTDCAKGDNCRCALTPEIVEVAERIKLPICQFAERPKCFEEIVK